MAREPLVMIAVGKKGVGKTVATMEQIYSYVLGNPEKGVPPRKALIFDVNDEFSSFWYHGEQHQIKAIAIKDILKYSVHQKIEVRRIRPFLDNGKRMRISDMNNVLQIILENYRNGLLLVEDINKYTNDTLRGDLVGSLATVRHVGIDLIAHYQSVGRSANPKLLGNTKIIRMHKTNDSVGRHENKFEEKAEILSIAEAIVNKKFEEGDERYFLYVDIDNSKIKGDFEQSDIDFAIQEYVSQNDKKLLSPLLKKIDIESGKKIYNPQSALKHLLTHLQKKYFR